MGNSLLMAGAGGAPAPQEPKANPLAAKPVSKGASSPPSGMMKHYGGQMESAMAKFKLMKQSKSQIEAIKANFGELTNLQDTVKPHDVVKAAGDITGAGVPAIAMAKVLAEMPEGPGQLQAWVKQKFEHAVQAEMQIDHALSVTRYQVVSSSIQNLIAHSAQGALMAGPAQGNA